MRDGSAQGAAGRRNAWLAIGVGGLVAGSFDLICAFLMFGIGVPRAIAGGLLGRAAFQGGAGTYFLGVTLHYLIAFSAAATYYSASRRLLFLRDHALICGLFFGIGLNLVMNLIVLPLSALHTAQPIATGLDSRPPGAHDSDRAAHLVQRPAVLPIGPFRSRSNLSFSRALFLQPRPINLLFLRQ